MQLSDPERDFSSPQSIPVTEVAALGHGPGSSQSYVQHFIPTASYQQHFIPTAPPGALQTFQEREDWRRAKGTGQEPKQWMERAHREGIAFLELPELSRANNSDHSLPIFASIAWNPVSYFKSEGLPRWHLPLDVQEVRLLLPTLHHCSLLQGDKLSILQLLS
jgi:hypothetical protein